MLESTRAKEEAVKRETTEQLDFFRRQQEEADKVLLEESGKKEDGEGGKAGSPTVGESQWAINARKRKRAKEKEVLKGVKIRKGSSTGEAPAELGANKKQSAVQESEKENPAASPEACREKRDLSGEASLEGKAVARTPAAPPSVPKTTAPSSQEGEAVSKPTGLGLAGYSSEEGD